MVKQQYSVMTYSVGTVLGFIEMGQIAIPEIQRPFVWDSTKVRDFLDSLYQGFPVGFLIAWKNPDVVLKDGRSSEGKRILIDGQQRVTALMAALMGREVVDKDYQKGRIQIAFHPLEEKFEVFNPAIQKNPAWIPDVAAVFEKHVNVLNLSADYCQRNPGTEQIDVLNRIISLSQITTIDLGMIELSAELDIETVTEIFIRVNSAGVPLSQADFVMSKIAVAEEHNGSTMRKAIDYFCHMARAPLFYETVKEDKAFVSTPYYAKMSWLKKEIDDLYDPSYVDLLRVVFASEFQRGRLADLVALLSGRNFETKLYEEAIVQSSFKSLEAGLDKFMSDWNFKQFVTAIKDTGYFKSSMIGSQNALNFAYALFLTLRDQGMAIPKIQKHVGRWFVMSSLTGRYSSSPETNIDSDIRQASGGNFEDWSNAVYAAQFSDAYWTLTLPLQLETSSVGNTAFRAFLAAQVRLDDNGFLAESTSVENLLTGVSNIHHVFPAAFLKSKGLERSRYNQVASYVVMPPETNIKIGKKEPRTYFSELSEQVAGGKIKYGTIIDPAVLKRNLEQNCIPEGIADMGIDDYPAFLRERRKLMAQRIRTYFESL